MAVKYLFSIILLAFGLTSSAQERYLDPVFAAVQPGDSIHYATNAGVLGYSGPAVDEARPTDLDLDLYQPEDSTATAPQRPLVILLHDGNFLPPTVNGGCEGTRQDAVVRELATRLAQTGYVVAAIDYRLGWNPIHPNTDVRVATFLHAIYRAGQDAHTAIRFFRASAAVDNPYRIDPKRIALWGIGTGGTAVLTAATLDAAAALDLEKFRVEGYPPLDESNYGDPTGTTLGVANGTPFFPPGDTLNYPNYAGFASDFSLAVSMSGFLGDTSWIDPSDPAILSFHVPTDPIAPYAVSEPQPPPLPPDLWPEVFGPAVFQSSIDSLQLNACLNDTDLIDPISQIARQRSGGLPGFLPLPSDDPQSSGDWFFSQSVQPYGVPPTADCGASPGNIDTALLVIDTILQYFLPRAYHCLDLAVLNEVSPADEELALRIYPTPATDRVRIEIRPDLHIDELHIFDGNGRLMRQVEAIGSHRFDLDRGGWLSGLYFVRIRSGDRVLSQRMLLH